MDRFAYGLPGPQDGPEPLVYCSSCGMGIYPLETVGFNGQEVVHEEEVVGRDDMEYMSIESALMEGAI